MQGQVLKLTSPLIQGISILTAYQAYRFYVPQTPKLYAFFNLCKHMCTVHFIHISETTTRMHYLDCICVHFIARLWTQLLQDHQLKPHLNPFSDNEFLQPQQCIHHF